MLHTFCISVGYYSHPTPQTHSAKDENESTEKSGEWPGVTGHASGHSSRSLDGQLLTRPHPSSSMALPHSPNARYLQRGQQPWLALSRPITNEAVLTLP